MRKMGLIVLGLALSVGLGGCVRSLGSAPNSLTSNSVVYPSPFPADSNSYGSGYGSTYGTGTGYSAGSGYNSPTNYGLSPGYGCYPSGYGYGACPTQANNPVPQSTPIPLVTTAPQPTPLPVVSPSAVLVMPTAAPSPTRRRLKARFTPTVRIFSKIMASIPLLKQRPIASRPLLQM
jgi:hypothetical protein